MSSTYGSEVTPVREPETIQVLNSLEEQINKLVENSKHLDERTGIIRSLNPPANESSANKDFSTPLASRILGSYNAVKTVNQILSNILDTLQV
jgi:hypothetical protein